MENPNTYNVFGELFSQTPRMNSDDVLQDLYIYNRPDFKTNVQEYIYFYETIYKMYMTILERNNKIPTLSQLHLEIMGFNDEVIESSVYFRAMELYGDDILQQDELDDCTLGYWEECENIMDSTMSYCADASDYFNVIDSVMSYYKLMYQIDQEGMIALYSEDDADRYEKILIFINANPNSEVYVNSAQTVLFPQLLGTSGLVGYGDYQFLAYPVQNISKTKTIGVGHSN